MIIATITQRNIRITDYVQTMLNISDEGDFQIHSVDPTEYGFLIVYKIWEYNTFHIREFKLFNSQILLLNSFLKPDDEI